ncbi:hypothetical protein FALBO_11168 [Fusarium albosuccineum]|uniref:Uncharacterized protein n=1 Tax=Fusarium albosuccineum TaxID=1237068 RepID=A0A8H4L5I7_9HYPO|nr:hypothetical protein FALBO_11168 [Fusarium albosuccineum]
MVYCWDQSDGSVARSPNRPRALEAQPGLARVDAPVCSILPLPFPVPPPCRNRYRESLLVALLVAGRSSLARRVISWGGFPVSAIPNMVIRVWSLAAPGDH